MLIRGAFICGIKIPFVFLGGEKNSSDEAVLIFIRGCFNKINKKCDRFHMCPITK